MSERLPPEMEELHAYVDGQLSARARQRVETRLAAEPEAKRAVEDYATIRQGLKTMFDPVLQEQIPEHMGRRPRQWMRPLAALAASLCLLITGAWIGIQLQGSALLSIDGAPDVVREAAMAYVVYTPEVRHPVEVPADQEQHLLAWLTKRLGAQVRAPHLDTLGYLLVGGRLLSSDDGPGALFMYESADGPRIVLYVCQNEKEGRNTAFRFAKEEGISVFYWFNGPFSYALAGELDHIGMLGLAEAAYSQIGA